MTTYLITIRRDDSHAVHKAGSVEEAACEIAHRLLEFRGNSQRLMAIKSASPLATFSMIKDDVLCSIEVTKKSIGSWRNDVATIETAINDFHAAKDKAESILTRALDDLDSTFDNSAAFNGYVPSDDISVYGVLDELGISDLEGTFNRVLGEMYKFKTFPRIAV